MADQARMTAEEELRKLEAELAMLESEMTNINHRLHEYGVDDNDLLPGEPKKKATKEGKSAEKKRKRETEYPPGMVSEFLTEPFVEGNDRSKRSRKKQKADMVGPTGQYIGFDIEAALKAEAEELKRNSVKQAEALDRDPLRFEAKFQGRPGFEYAAHLIDELMRHQHAAPFNEPVDYVTLQLPDYLAIVQTPMDLGTIRYKVFSEQYQAISEYVADIRMVWRNAMLYNFPESEIFAMAQLLSAVSFHAIKTLVSIEARRSTIPRSEVVAHISFLPVLLRHAQMNLEAMRNLGSAWAFGDFVTLSARFDPRVRPRFEVRVSTVSPLERESLTRGIANLSGSELRNVVQIIEEEAPHLISEDSLEFDIDFSTLDDFTMTRIKEYLTAINAAI